MKLASHKIPNAAFSHFYELAKVVKLLETGSRMVVTKGWREGEMGSCSMGIVSVWQDEKILQTRGI